jgi:hypothetical protein
MIDMHLLDNQDTILDLDLDLDITRDMDKEPIPVHRRVMAPAIREAMVQEVMVREVLRST